MSVSSIAVEILTSSSFENSTDIIGSEIRAAYLENNTPWIICYSGGKDSTALLQLICYALSELPQEQLQKEIHVLSNNTLVENPAISDYVCKQLIRIETYGRNELYRHAPDLFFVNQGTPDLADRFWLNLIGKGYPSPNRWFRWCTERLKINPTNNYIEGSLKKHDKVIIVLGTRKDESSNRAASMKKYESAGRFRQHTLTNALVFAPIADMSNNDVWAYLLNVDNIWGSNNGDLLDIYGNACNGGECPFVIESGTQSCGKSRFGCWVCTVVDRDKSMENFVSNGNAWMKGLLEYRNWLYEIRQQDMQYVPPTLNNKVKFGPFLLRTRIEMLNKLLALQANVGIELISAGELQATQEIIEWDKREALQNGMRRFVFETKRGERFAAISDCDIGKMNRKRLGSINLNSIKIIDSKDVNEKYEKSKRLMYYRLK